MSVELDGEAIALYAQAREAWHMRLGKMKRAEKDAAYAHLTLLWGRMGKAEQRIAGAEACMLYH